jgi:RimJ/RimL family protein N-acetyltransferase
MDLNSPSGVRIPSSPPLLVNMNITINKLVEGDIPGMHRELRNSHGHLKELGWIATSFYAPFRHHFKQLMVMDDLLIFVIRVDGKVAGAIEIESKSDCYFMGYWLGLNYRKQGIMTRCIEDIIKNDLPIKKPLTARVEQTNTKSIAVLTRLGFKTTHKDSEWVYYKKVW